MLFEGKSGATSRTNTAYKTTQSAGGTPVAGHSTPYLGRVSGLGGKELLANAGGGIHGSSQSTMGSPNSFGISRSGGSSRIGGGSTGTSTSSYNTRGGGSTSHRHSQCPQQPTTSSSPLHNNYNNMCGGQYSLSPREEGASPTGHSPAPVPQFGSPVMRQGVHQSHQSRQVQPALSRKASAASLPPSATHHHPPGGTAHRQPQLPYTGISAALPPAPVKSQYSPSRSASARYTPGASGTPGGSSSSGSTFRKPPIEIGGTILEYERRSSATTTSNSVSQRSVLRTYSIGVKLGQGAFASVYEVTDNSSGEVFAAKIVDKAARLTDDKKRQKMFMEIKIHEKLRHVHVLQFVRQFQDEHYHYLLLERCLGSSLMEISRVRNVFTVPETQYIMIQLLEALTYLHSHNVIHRDLKLANVIIDENLNMKLGDFGLATEMTYNGQRKWTKCGTPNYIAPEVLSESEGYDFACDTWSLGVLLYTLLVGIPPFETEHLHTTYTRIQQGRYSYPINCHVSPCARQLIASMLQCQPEKRPSLVDIRLSSFFKDSPKSAPHSLLETLPTEDYGLARRALLKQEQQKQQQQQGGGGESAARRGDRSASVSSLATQQYQPPRVDAEFEGDEAAVFEGGQAPRHTHSQTPTTLFRPSSKDGSHNRYSDPNDSLPRPTVGPGSAVATIEPRKVPVQVLKSENPNGPRFAPHRHSPQHQQYPAPARLYGGSDGGSPMMGDHFSRGGGSPLAMSSSLHGSPLVAVAPPIPRADHPLPIPQQQQQKLNTNTNNSSYSPSPTNSTPELFPGVWVTRVLDYTRKYGVSCELNDGSLSAVFNDRTKLLWRLTNGSVAYHCRHTNTGNVQADVLHDAFAVDATGEPTVVGSSSNNASPIGTGGGGGGTSPQQQERQTIKKMTLSKYFRGCFDSTATIKERVMLLDIFPNPNHPPRSTASFVKPALGSAAATGVYVKSVTSVCALPGNPSQGEPVRFEVVSATSVLPTTSFDRQGGQYACLVFRFSDGSAQVQWEPNSFCQESGDFRLVEQVQPISHQSNAACRLQSCLSLHGCGATVILSPDALLHPPGFDRAGSSDRATNSATPASVTSGSNISPMMLLGERGDGGPSPFIQGGGGLAALSPTFPLTLCGEGHPAEATSVPILVNSMERAHRECGFPRPFGGSGGGSPHTNSPYNKDSFHAAAPGGGGQGNLTASSLVVDMGCGGALESEGALVCALVQVSQAAVFATNPGSLAQAAGVN